MSNLKVNTINDASGGSNAQLFGVASPPNSMGFRNRLINSDMRIDQRNAGASVTPTDGQYTLDRWNAGLTQASKFSVQQSSTAPAGFSSSLLVTSLSVYSVGSSDLFRVGQYIEGFNFADLAWGTANAQSVTLSFQVRSSLTGTFSGALANSAFNRSYPFTYTISAANTWETKTVIITGDTTGTWVGSANGIGARVNFSLGAGSSFSGAAGAWAASTLIAATGATSVVGTNGATLNITGVQLEAGTVASAFERRDYGRELMMCQRYLPAFNSTGTTSAIPSSGYCTSSTDVRLQIKFPVTTRVPPTGVTSPNATHISLQLNGGTNYTASGLNLTGINGTDCAYMGFIISGGVTDKPANAYFNNAAGQILFTGCEL